MKPTRALTTFAYVAEEFARTNDIARGLLPLFAPVISKRAGTTFDPAQFAQDIKTTYDLELHPLAAEEFAPSLAARGYLHMDRQPGAVHYMNVNIELPDPPVQEDQLRELVDGFCLFSEGRLGKTGLHLEPEQLQAAFFDRLVQRDFLGLVLRPDRPPAEPGIHDHIEGKPGRDTPRSDQQLDYLVASYLLHAHENTPEIFESIVAAASGALVSEVVLNLQHPIAGVHQMSGVDIAIDSPLVLDAMELGHDGVAPYAKALIDQIKKAGARPVVFEATVEEIRGALTGPLKNFERRVRTYGPLGRRLRTNSATASYVRLVLGRLTEEIGRLGIHVLPISTVDRHRNRTVFTEMHENQMANELDFYESDSARLHDARVVADVLRLRGREHVTSISQAKVVFVTRNGRLARRTRRYLSEHALIAHDYFPPCISDRHVAGLLWISVGGGGDTLSRTRLVANCSATVTPRHELVSRMHRFFKDLNPAMEERFQALMTNERAEHYLMDRTLSDVTVIKDENFEEIYRDIEEAAAERVIQRKDGQIESLKAEHLRELAGYKARQSQDEEAVRTAERDAQQMVQNVEGLTDRSEQLADKKRLLAEQLELIERKWALTCLKRGQRVTFAMHGALLAMIALVAGMVSIMGDENIALRVAVFVLTFCVTLGASVLGNRIWPNNPLERWIERRRDSAVRRFAGDSKVEQVLAKYELDWDAGKVKRHREPSDVGVRERGLEGQRDDEVGSTIRRPQWMSIVDRVKERTVAFDQNEIMDLVDREVDAVRADRS